MECLFCRIIAGEIPSKTVYEDERSVAFLDISPWQVGHTLVVPREHSRDLLDGDDVLSALAPSITAVSRLLREKLDASAINVLINVGADAGQEVFHTHVHVIPRYAQAPGFGAIRGTASEPGATTLARILGEDQPSALSTRQQR